MKETGPGDRRRPWSEAEALHFLVMTSMFALAGGHLWWIHRRVIPRVLEGRDDAPQWRGALLYAAWVMILTLLVNAQGFAKTNLIMYELGARAGTGWLRQLASHASVLAGTASLMWLVVRSLQDPAVLQERTPMLGASRAMVLIAEKLLPQFWWAALGLGVVFGCSAGSGPVLLLATDLTLFWLIGRISLVVQRRRFRRGGAE